ncbi:MAG: phosphate ABC transporter substrate-binding protein PstS [Elusimicrobiota bacterium]
MKKLLGSLLAGLMVMSGTTAWAEALLINGAGATFPFPIYSKWFDEYHKSHPDIQFNYQSIGSGGGIRQVSARTVDFGATDGPMTDAQLEAAKGTLLHFPTVLGGVVPAYNVEGVTEKLSFTQKAIAGIFLGDIANWNDPEIQKANPGVKLPAAPIVVVHRSDGSGTSYCWTDYLSKISSKWVTRAGRGTSVNWPVGLGGKGNEGVAGLVKQTPNTIGYVELIYAKHNSILYGKLQNKAGNFVDCSEETISAAAASAKMPFDFRVSITNADGAQAYPASTFTWLLIYASQSDKQKGQALVDFLHWMLKDGQKFAPELGYAPLPAEVSTKVEAAIKKIKV